MKYFFAFIAVPILYIWMVISDRKKIKDHPPYYEIEDTTITVYKYKILRSGKGLTYDQYHPVSFIYENGKFKPILSKDDKIGAACLEIVLAVSLIIAICAYPSNPLVVLVSGVLLGAIFFLICSWGHIESMLYIEKNREKIEKRMRHNIEKKEFKENVKHRRKH